MPRIKMNDELLFCKDRDCYYCTDTGAEVKTDRRIIHRPEDVVDELRFMQKDDREKMCVCPIDASNHLLGYEIISSGTANETPFTPCMAFQSVFSKKKYGSMVSLIMVHNHPSGEVKPSEEDYGITRNMVKACRIMRIALLDHIIIGKFMDGRSKYYSMERHDSEIFDRTE